jgi:hypothetical protein
MIATFVTELTKPGGIVEQVGKFLEDLKDPKTEAGQMFKNIKDAVNNAFTSVKNFFALFGNGDAMTGFGKVASALVRMLPALIALKGILWLAQTGAALKNLAIAIGLMKGNPFSGNGNPFGFLGAAAKDAGKTIPKLADIGKVGFEGLKIGLKDLFPLLGAGTGTRLGTLTPEQLKNNPGDIFGQGKTGKYVTNNNVTINVHAADPKATVDAVSQFVKTNGALPSTWLANRH